MCESWAHLPQGQCALGLAAEMYWSPAVAREDPFTAVYGPGDCGTGCIPCQDTPGVPLKHLPSALAEGQGNGLVGVG